MLGPWETIEIAAVQVTHSLAFLPRHPNLRVAVTTSLASVNNVEMPERELETSRESLNTGSKFTLGQRRKLVEERLDRSRIDDLNKNHEDEAGDTSQLFRD